MIAQGLLDNAKSVSYPVIQEVFNLTATEYGALQSTVQFSYMIWALITASVLGYFGFKFTFLIGFLISMIGCFVTTKAKGFTSLLLTQFFACAGMGILDDGPNALSSVLFTKNTGILMLLLHAFYGVGASFGPVLAGFMIRTFPSLSFSGIYYALTLCLFVFLVLVFLSPFSIDDQKPSESDNVNSSLVEKQVSNTASDNEPSFWRTLFSLDVWFVGSILALFTVIERSTSNWSGLYIKYVLHLDPAVEGVWFNSWFYVLFTLARVVGGVLVDKFGAFVVEYSCLILSILIFLVGFLMKQTGLYVLIFVGPCVAFFWPSLICIAMRYWKAKAARPVSCILPIQAFLGIIFQFLLGVLAETYGTGAAYYSSVPIGIFTLILLIVFHMKVLKQEKQTPECDVTVLE